MSPCPFPMTITITPRALPLDFSAIAGFCTQKLGVHIIFLILSTFADILLF